MFDEINAVPLENEDPHRIDQYDIQGRLGTGGQGIVYLGRAPDGRPVAVKVLKSGELLSEESRMRFVQELAAARRVPQAHTAAILDADVEGRRPYIVSEYIAGMSLQETVEKNGVFKGNNLERLATYTITALAAIHSARVVHRDFKPANVLIGPDGPRVVDFGIARALDFDGQATNSLIGTPPYMAPEQFAGQPVGPFTDVFAWASTLVFAATGNPPFGRMSFPAVANRILNENPDLADLPVPLRDVLARCLAKNPADRPSSIQVLQMLVGHGTSVEPHSPGYGMENRGGYAAVFPATGNRESEPTRRSVPWFRKGAVIASLAATLVAVLVAVTLTLGNEKPADTGPLAAPPSGNGLPAHTGPLTAMPSGNGLPEGLAALWDFSERSGSEAKDSIAENKLILQHGANWEAHLPSRAKGALHFDGVKGYAVTAPTPLVDSSSSFTAAARVRIDRAPDDFYFAAAASQETAGGHASFSLQYMSCDGRAEPDSGCLAQGEYWVFSMHDENGEAERLISSTKVEALDWVHLAAVHDRQAGTAGEIRLYVDGRLEGVKSLKKPIPRSTGPFYVGRATSGDPVDFWPGAVTNVAVWNRALSPSETQGIAAQM